MKEQRDDEESLTRIHLVIGSSSPVLLLSLMQGYCQRPKISESSEQGPVTWTSRRPPDPDTNRASASFRQICRSRRSLLAALETATADLSHTDFTAAYRLPFSDKKFCCCNSEEILCFLLPLARSRISAFKSKYFGLFQLRAWPHWGELKVKHVDRSYPSIPAKSSHITP